LPPARNPLRWPLKDEPIGLSVFYSLSLPKDADLGKAKELGFGTTFRDEGEAKAGKDR